MWQIGWYMVIGLNMILYMYVYEKYLDARDRRTGYLIVFHASTPFYQRVMDLSFSSSATAPSCLDSTQGGLDGWPARGLVRPASSQTYAKPSKRQLAHSSVPKHETLLSEGGATSNCCCYC